MSATGIARGDRLGFWIGTCGGVGVLRPAPGTLGSVAALAVWVLALAPLGTAIQLGATVGVTAVGIWAAGRAARVLDRGDPSDVVVDEWAGMWLALVGFADPWIAVWAFLLFRLFDIVKPFPGRFLDRRSGRLGGFGIVADDLVAALYAQLVLRLGLEWL